MDKCFCNPNNKIWLFWDDVYDVNVLFSDDQYVSACVKGVCGIDKVIFTAVYAKCNSEERKDLWEAIDTLSSSVDCPWAVFGDFNVITNAEEKKGGRPFNISNSLDFLNCIEDSGLQDAGFLGDPFTWCDNKGHRAIWKRLDRVLINAEWNSNPIKFFKFLNFWVEHNEFLTVVQQAWEENIYGNPLWILHQKLKKTCKALSVWSRVTFGDIFEEVDRMEDKIS
ncbi:uncharacterized protein LOC132066118 [Lycium ferocissimum]|uniref:uncharacterized protein LOC132066118 n=1 Tax=Lycium ferocissimum TaxID=112874 RepID=UPI00281633F4|nr:uncharacterized protein LOC132066118 [Lycium ferocissimum]